ncbi:MAG: MerR family DNA-binding transcriptional regulator [Thermoflexales bacterium]|nr:MerR family DNA-binding transcriptional regulator [Thermoflexales bacterium]
MVKEHPLVSLKEAARALSVHEQTIRNWERRGIIRLVRLPGSRYRRVPVSEIVRLQARLWETEPSSREGVLLETPSGDASLAAQGQAMAENIQATLNSLELTVTLDELMHSLRGRLWSS